MERRPGADILMITHRRPEYTRLSLAKLLSTAREDTRIWLWHNGDDEETLSIVSDHAEHPLVSRFHHSRENVKLREPSNWILAEGQSEYVGKVDDDCLVPDNWIDILTRAHQDEARFGVLGCWIYLDEDFEEEAASKKIRSFGDDHQVMCHPWVGGSGFLMKRECVGKVGGLREQESGISDFMIRVAFAGWTNGWYFPFLYQEHMDDPRVPNTLLKADSDFERYAPLSAWRSGATTLAQWEDQLRSSAAQLQHLPSSTSYYRPWRRSLRRLRGRLGFSTP